MRRLWMLYLVLGLVAAQGCHKTLQHTGGACDCYAPPVESLLIAPCPSKAYAGAGQVVSPYAPAPHYTAPSSYSGSVLNGPGELRINKPVFVPAAPAGAVRHTAPDSVPTTEKTKVETSGEPIRSLPRIAEPK